MMHQFLLKYPPFFHKSAKFKFSEDDIVDKIVEEHLFKMSSIMKVSYPRYEPLFSNACRVMFKDWASFLKIISLVYLLWDNS